MSGKLHYNFDNSGNIFTFGNPGVRVPKIELESSTNLLSLEIQVYCNTTRIIRISKRFNKISITRKVTAD